MADPILDFVKSHAIRLINPKKIVLFGSRARQDHSERSDYDLAFIGIDSKRWAEFVLWIDEEAPTLLEFDLVHYESASDEMKKSIDAEGVIIYERKGQ